MTPNARFKARLAREPLLGTFVKTPHPAAVEIVGSFAVTGSDHSFLTGGARALVAGFAPLRKTAGDQR